MWGTAGYAHGTGNDETGRSAVSTPWTPDEIEQRQRADGTVESDRPAPPDEDAPRSPDEIEQRQTDDDEVDVLEEEPGRPLSPDEIEQRQVVGGEPDEEPGRGEPTPHYPAGADEE